MRHRTILAALILGLTFMGARASADNALPPGPQSVPANARAQQEALRGQLVQKMRPEVRPRVEATARVVIFDVAVQQHNEHTAAKSGPKPPPLDLLASTRAHVADAQNYGISNPQPADIDALVFIVLLEAAHDADADLRAATAAMRAANRAKAKERDLAEKLRHEQDLRKEDLDRIASILKDKAEDAKALADLSQEMALRVQLAQERQTKFTSLLSNILKQQTDAARAIVSNMK